VTITVEFVSEILTKPKYRDDDIIAIKLEM